MLPLELPELENFAPESSDDPDAKPKPPLGRVTDWVEVEQACPRRAEYTISIVQTMLKNKGDYKGEITNDLNGETNLAIAKFRKDNGLPFDSTLDSPTLKLLGLVW